MFYMYYMYMCSRYRSKSSTFEPIFFFNYHFCFIFYSLFSFLPVLWAQLAFHAIRFNQHTIIILSIVNLPASKVHIVSIYTLDTGRILLVV